MRPLPFLLPVFRGDRHGFNVIRFGAWLYSRLAGNNKLKPEESFTPSRTRQFYPFLSNAKIKGAVRYFDAQMDDIRLCLETILSAQAEGAKVVNHVEVIRVGMRSDGKFDVVLQDRLTKDEGKARASVVVNAAGPWADRVLSILEPRHKPLLHLSKGIHLLVNKRFSDDAVVLSSSDRRIVFMIPWRNGSLIGTTDTEFQGSPDDLSATADEVNFLLTEIKRTTGLDIQKRDIITTFAGVRPLAADAHKNTAATRRDHVIQELPPGFFSIAGGKFTTHRLLAEQVCDQIEAALKKPHEPCRTAELPLTGSFDLPQDESGFHVPRDISSLSRRSLQNLIHTYGRQIKYVVAVSNRSADLQKPLCAHHWMIGAQVIYSIEQELARTLLDVCVRRLRLDQATCRGLDCVRKIADLMAERLRWPESKKQEEIAEYLKWVQRNTACIT